MVDLQTLKYHRFYSDASGESHLHEVEVKQSLAKAAPPAPPLLVSAFNPAIQWGFFSTPEGWFGDWHPAPARQFMILLSGAVNVMASDGRVLQMRPSDIVLLEDTWGRGHMSRNVSDGVCHYFVARLPVP
jgi:uncharacterized cupin superfamily protein